MAATVSLVRIQDQLDFSGTPGAGTDGYALTWDNATSRFVLEAVTVPAAANPSASVGLSAVNGSASTFLRSDAAPALDQSIAPTWTGLHIFDRSANLKLQLGSDVVNEISELRLYGNHSVTTGWYGYLLAQESGFTIGSTANRTVTLTSGGNGGLTLTAPGNGAISLAGPYSSLALGQANNTCATITGVVSSDAGIKTLVVNRPTNATGALIQLQARSSTTSARAQADIDTAWNDSTDATRSADLILRAYYTSTAREGVRVRGGSSDVQLGFYGVTPVSRATTGIAEASFTENAGGTAVNVDSTFGGYTLQQVVQALQSVGVLT